MAPRTALGIALVVSGCVLLPVALHRQWELALGADDGRAYRDLETLLETVSAAAFLFLGGTILRAGNAELGAKVRALREKLGAAEARESQLGAQLASAESAVDAGRVLPVQERPAREQPPEEFRIADPPPPPDDPLPAVTRSVSPPAVARLPSNRPSVPRSSSLPPPTSSPPSSWSVGRRSRPRLDIQVEVGLESESNFYMGFSENVSEGGLFIATYSVRPIGTELDLSLKLPEEDEPVRARGTVRWVRELSEGSEIPPGMGIRFERIKEGDEPRIRQFLSSRPPMFFDDE